jgi:transcriptional regulator with XRE-family HTH domain
VLEGKVMEGRTIENISDTFGDRIRKLRKIKGINTEELGLIVNRKATAIRMWETNKAFPDYKTLEVIADYFGCSFDYLFGRNTLKHEKVMKIERDVMKLLEEIRT